MSIVKSGGYGQVTISADYAVKVTPLFRSDQDCMCVANLKEAVFFQQVYVRDDSLTEFLDVRLKDECFHIRQKRYEQDLSDWAHANAYMTRLGKLYEFSEKLSGGLHRIHQRGFVHGDFKPRNVLVDGDRLRITDFGSLPSFREIGWSTCTYAFRAPELLVADVHPDARSDAFSLGLTLHHLLLKFVPMQHIDSPDEMLAEYQKEVASGKLGVDLSAVERAIDSKVMQLLLQLLVYDPKSRMTCSEFFSRIKAYRKMESGLQIEADIPDPFSTVMNATASVKTRYDLRRRQNVVRWLYKVSKYYSVLSSFALAVNIFDRLCATGAASFPQWQACVCACLILAEALVDSKGLSFEDIAKQCTIKSPTKKIKHWICKIIQALDLKLYSDTFDWMIRKMTGSVDFDRIFDVAVANVLDIDICLQRYHDPATYL